MAISLKFTTAASRLLPLIDHFATDTEEDLRTFYEAAMKLISRTDSIRSDQDDIPGYSEWCDFRAEIYVGWSLYWRWSKSFLKPRNDYRPNLEEARGLLQEVLGEVPLRGKERWLQGVEERSRSLTERCETMAEFDYELRCLIDDADGRYAAEYREIYNRLKAEFADKHFTDV